MLEPLNNFGHHISGSSWPLGHPKFSQILQLDCSVLRANCIQRFKPKYHRRFRLKRTLRIAIFLSFACAALGAFSNFAQAQKVDFAFGVSSVIAPGANSQGPSLSGGTYPGFSGDVLFWHNFGIGAEVYWKATQSNYPGIPPTPFRPLFLDFNGVYAPKLASHTWLELSAGIGAVDTRIYCSQCGNGYNTNYDSDKHFMGDLGAGIKFYPIGNFFVRPEAKIYLVTNNQLFSSSYATRVGASIGYTFGKH
jgi:hypothetical protein